MLLIFHIFLITSINILKLSKAFCKIYADDDEIDVYE